MTKEVDFKLVEQLCGIFCTEEEISGILGITKMTLRNRIKEVYGWETTFPILYEKWSSKGKMSIRREQFSLAMKGNERLLIWLGKQVLDQRDKNEVGFDPNRPAVFKLAMGKTIEREKDEDDE